MISWCTSHHLVYLASLELPWIQSRYFSKLFCRPLRTLRETLFSTEIVFNFKFLGLIFVDEIRRNMLRIYPSTWLVWIEKIAILVPWKIFILQFNVFPIILFRSTEICSLRTNTLVTKHSLVLNRHLIRLINWTAKVAICQRLDNDAWIVVEDIALMNIARWFLTLSIIKYLADCASILPPHRATKKPIFLFFQEWASAWIVGRIAWFLGCEV